MTSRVREIQIQFPRQGRLEWIGLRPTRGQDVRSTEAVMLTPEDGLIGDRFDGPPGADRQVTLIQKEHLTVIAQLLGQLSINPALTRRNLVVSGVNLTALKGKRFQIGEVVLEGTGACAPCSKMEAALGPGGFNAMRGHGGITARVVHGGQIHTGDPLAFVAEVRQDK
ncbi:MAG: MOSC domain-containing protein [Pirellulaceae bacterium]|nr:MOSC domain-containing protein [Pirellulaceae bacterium]